MPWIAAEEERPEYALYSVLDNEATPQDNEPDTSSGLSKDAEKQAEGEEEEAVDDRSMRHQEKFT